VIEFLVVVLVWAIVIFVALSFNDYGPDDEEEDK
jgi:hypothetical protein